MAREQDTRCPADSADGAGDATGSPKRLEAQSPPRRSARHGSIEAGYPNNSRTRWRLDVLDDSADSTGKVRARIVWGPVAGSDAAEHAGPQPLTWPEVLHLWARDQDFQDFFSLALGEMPFRSFFWETAPLCPSWIMTEQPFEMVILDARGQLADCGDSAHFSEHLEGEVPGLHEPIRVFPNDESDALLFVPIPLSHRQNYPHLAAFVRGAPLEQRRELWRELGEAGEWRMEGTGRSPVWICTDGRGPPWLHVRIDSCPKHTKHAPYCEVPSPVGTLPLGLPAVGWDRGIVDFELPEQAVAAANVQMATFLAGEAAANARLVTREFELFLDDNPPCDPESLDLRRARAWAVEKSSLLIEYALLLREATIDARDALEL